MRKAFLITAELPEWNGRFAPTVVEVDVLSEGEEGVIILRNGEPLRVPPEMVFDKDDPVPPVKVVPPDDPRVDLDYTVACFLDGAVGPELLPYIAPADIEEALKRAREHPWIALPERVEFLEEYLNSRVKMA